MFFSPALRFSVFEKNSAIYSHMINSCQNKLNPGSLVQILIVYILVVFFSILVLEVSSHLQLRADLI